MSKTTNYPIVLTLGLLTKEQAAALIEAYGQIMEGNAGTFGVTDAGDQSSVTANVPVVKPAAPAAPNAQAAAINTPGELDNTGVPYNPAVHAPSKKLTGAGTWMVKKGQTEAAKIWAANRAKAPAAPSVPPAPPAPPAPAWGPIAPAAYPPVDYATFGALYTRLATAGKIDGNHVAAIQAATNTPDAATYSTDAGARAHAYALLQAYDV